VPQGDRERCATPKRYYGMFSTVSLIGFAAALCTTASYVPQLHKCWTTGSTHDLSRYMLSVLATGLALWIVYGVMQGDWVIIGANTVSLAMLLTILGFKVREILAERRGRPSPAHR
jgi:MtN3 and saliva related transmembrane protein